MSHAQTDRIRVLHVDDEPDFVELAAQFLEREDERLEVLTATCPSEGLSLLSDREVDVVVSDYEMPEADGLWFESQVRSEYPFLPFILYTAQDREELPRTESSRAPLDYVQKRVGTNQFATLADRVASAVETQ